MFANTVASETNKLTRNAVSGFTSDGFVAVAPSNSGVNGFAITLIAVLGVISLISVYMLYSFKKEKARKAARATMRQERRMSRVQSETRYWW